MGLLGRLFGSEAGLEKGLEMINKGVDGAFYTSEEIDWSSKTDRAQKVTQKMISNDYQKIIRFKYK